MIHTGPNLSQQLKFNSLHNRRTTTAIAQVQTYIPEQWQKQFNPDALFIQKSLDFPQTSRHNPALISTQLPQWRRWHQTAVTVLTESGAEPENMSHFGLWTPETTRCFDANVTGRCIYTCDAVPVIESALSQVQVQESSSGDSCNPDALSKPSVYKSLGGSCRLSKSCWICFEFHASPFHYSKYLPRKRP